MGLLNDFPDDLLELIRNAAQNRSPSANSGAGSANDLPSWVPRQQQRLPLSFAGPVLTADINASSPSPPGAAFPLPGPADASADTGLSWLRGDRRTDPLRARPPAPPAQDLTTQALRMKGVPEADIAAAIGNPDLMKRLIIWHLAPVLPELLAEPDTHPTAAASAEVRLVSPDNVLIRKPARLMTLARAATHRPGAASCLEIRPDIQREISTAIAPTPTIRFS
jgi:hypothetical protein